jgi:hypothetical protein
VSKHLVEQQYQTKMAENRNITRMAGEKAEGLQIPSE